MLIGVVGTTIAPWMQFYQQSAVVEKGVTIEQYSFSRLDVIVGCIRCVDADADYVSHIPDLLEEELVTVREGQGLPGTDDPPAARGSDLVVVQTIRLASHLFVETHQIELVKWPARYEHRPRPDFAPAGPLPLCAAPRKRRLAQHRRRISPVLDLAFAVFIIRGLGAFQNIFTNSHKNWLTSGPAWRFTLLKECSGIALGIFSAPSMQGQGTLSYNGAAGAQIVSAGRR